MTDLEIYEKALIEINKLEAPSLLLEDYNHFINKAVQQYTNLVYNRYEINQQATDDLYVLKKSINIKVNTEDNIDDYLGNVCSKELPQDYLHMLSCVVKFSPKENIKCYEKGKNLYYTARRWTSDILSGSINNAYMCPSYRRPYYRIINNENNKIEINFGRDSLFKIEEIYIDYIRKPALIELTHEKIENGNATVLEFPDYACYEILNIFTKLLFENASDPRLQTNIPINQTIPSGAQPASTN